METKPIDPVLHALETAPLDDEPITPEEEARVTAAFPWIRDASKHPTDTGGYIQVRTDGSVEVSVGDDHYSGSLPPEQAHQLALAILQRLPQDLTLTPVAPAERGHAGTLQEKATEASRD